MGPKKSTSRPAPRPVPKPVPKPASKPVSSSQYKNQYMANLQAQTRLNQQYQNSANRLNMYNGRERVMNNGTEYNPPYAYHPNQPRAYNQPGIYPEDIQMNNEEQFYENQQY
jgi:hypothetical protein